MSEPVLAESSETTLRILAAAGPAFADRGYRAATVREICAAAGVNLASVNYHFGDKWKLYVEVIKYAHRRKSQQVPLPAWSADTPPQQKLRQFIHVTLTRMIGDENEPWQARLMMREVLEPTGAATELVEGYFRPHLEVLLGILDQFLPAETSLSRRRQWAFSIIGQCIFYRFSREILHLLVPQEELAAHFRPEQLAEHIADVSLRALTGASREGAPAGNWTAATGRLIQPLGY